MYQVATSLLAYDIQKATTLLEKDSISNSSLLNEYHSHNTYRLNKEELTKIFMDLNYVKNELK